MKVEYSMAAVTKAVYGDWIVAKKEKDFDEFCTEADRVQKEIEEEDRIVNKFW